VGAGLGYSYTGPSAPSMVEPASKVPIPEPEDVVRAMADPSNDLGKYVKVERLGAGGMGEVWSAWDRDLHRRVALKFLRRDDPEEVERFKREALTVAHLSHPNIAFIYEVGQAGGKPFIAMQLIKGTTLGAFPRKDRKLLFRLVREIPAQLQAADIKKLIRDLADELSEQDSISSLEGRLNHVLATLACHCSVRSGRKLELSEMDALLREMEATPHSGQCNHGRPTYVELKLSDIERLFGRH